MKTLFLSLAIIFISSSILFSQESQCYIKDNILYFHASEDIMPDGSTKDLKFSISDETIQKIKESDYYKETKTDEEFLQKNKERNINSPLEAHLYSSINGAFFSTRFKLKNPVSFKPLEESKHEVYWDKDNGLTIVIYFESQNDLGNYIKAKSVNNDNGITIVK